MPSIENYRPLQNLPALAGLGEFADAASSGIGVQACVDLLKRYHYAYQRLWRIFLGRKIAEPIYEIKMGFSHHTYLSAEAITLLRNRVAEMRHPPLGLDKEPSAHLASYFDEILAAPNLYTLIFGVYHHALPQLRNAMAQHVEETNILADAPSIRLLRIVITEVDDMMAWGEKALAALDSEVSEEDRKTVEDWGGELDAWLKAAGGLDGLGEAEAPPKKRFSLEPYQYDSRPQRDERFPDPYNMGVHAEEFLYDESFATKDKVLMMYYKRLREIDVPEMMASILFEMARDQDEDSGGQPWGFFRDMSRQLWDEARHAMMGEVGFAKLGIDWAKLVRINFTWSKGLNEQLTPTERHAVLWYIEQGLMTKTGKRYEWEVGKDSGDDLSELFQDYDWADEVLHARIGRDWYVKNFETVKEAAEYGSACWDKVVSDWDAWKKEGLTEHFNWWPSLYREACRLRGEEPDPKTEAYSRSYAETRADLQRIAASG